MDPLSILKQQFGYADFRFNQEAVIHAVLEGKDTFVLMPTGGGKSICYQIPALLLDGLTIVISPLIALMKNQVDALRLNGIPAAYLNSTQTSQEQEALLQEAREKKLKLLYLAPEKLLANSMALLHTLQGVRISLIAIDEAHCISEWGHDFRPEYLMLAQFRNTFPDVPVIALTATADQLTRKDIVEKLELRNPETFVSSFNRPNIRYRVEPRKQGSFSSLLKFLEEHREESGIIYCLARKSTERLVEELQLHGFSALPYHAGMDRDQRSSNQERFLRDEVNIMVATIAFGMGIDKPNVRYVVHMDLPKNIESYYQETGRAGRDGLPCEALLFYSYGDVLKLKKFARIEANPGQTDILLRKLDQMGRYGDLSSCRRKYLLDYFGEESTDFCGNCDRCIEALSYDSSTNGMNTLDVLLQHATSAVKRVSFEKDLYNKLKYIRREIAAEEHLPPFFVLPDVALREMATWLPSSPDELECISGVGKTRSLKYGRRFLGGIRSYCSKYRLTSRMQFRVANHESGKRASDKSTMPSLDLFRKGYPVTEIAALRKLPRATVEEHLACCVQRGKLPVEELLKAERIIAIRQAVDQVGATAAKPVKDFLKEEYSLTEIRYVLADLTKEQMQEPALAHW